MAAKAAVRRWRERLVPKTATGMTTRAVLWRCSVSAGLGEKQLGRFAKMRDGVRWVGSRYKRRWGDSVAAWVRCWDRPAVHASFDSGAAHCGQWPAVSGQWSAQRAWGVGTAGQGKAGRLQREREARDGTGGGRCTSSTCGQQRCKHSGVWAASNSSTNGRTSTSAGCTRSG